MTNAKLRQERVDRSNLYPGAPTAISQLGSRYMILTIRRDER